MFKWGKTGLQSRSQCPERCSGWGDTGGGLFWLGLSPLLKNTVPPLDHTNETKKSLCMGFMSLGSAHTKLRVLTREPISCVQPPISAPPICGIPALTLNRACCIIREPGSLAAEPQQREITGGPPSQHQQHPGGAPWSSPASACMHRGMLHETIYM